MNKRNLSKLNTIMDIQLATTSAHAEIVDSIRSEHMITCMAAGINRHECAKLINLNLIKIAQKFLENDASEEIFDKLPIVE